MNGKLYWKIRKKLLNWIFRLKRLGYGIISSAGSEKEYLSFWSTVIKYTLLIVVKTALIAFFVKKSETLLLSCDLLVPIEASTFMDAVIGGIGVAGVILGLYCANISSIYSAKYADAPKQISQAFQNDKLTQKCIKSLIEYIVFGLIVITEILLGSTLSWVTVVVVVIWSIAVIVSYSLVGNRTYRLSDIYAVAIDTHRVLFKTVNKRLKMRAFSSDVNFQNHFQKTSEKQINLLQTIQRYASKVETIDNSSMYEFMGQNLALISSYWDTKPTISKDSLWYKNEGKYQKWHFSSATEMEVALSTGTPLLPKDEHDYHWFEKGIFEINKACLKELINKRDYITLYRYTRLLLQVVDSAVSANELGFYIEQLNTLCQYFENDIAADTIEEKRSIAGVIEALSAIFLSLYLSVVKHCKSYDLNEIEQKILLALDSGIPVDKLPILRGRVLESFYKKIKFELATEGHRITPDWIIKQSIANEEYMYLNSLLDAIIDGVNTLFSMGQKLAERKELFEACIILSRFYEFESKYASFRVVITNTLEAFESRHLDSEQKWDESKFESLEETVSNWRKEIPEVLATCASSLAIETWDNRDEYPDFLGESFNHICVDAVDAIMNNNLSLFKTDYESLTKLMLLYQEYIRSDFVKKKDLYRIEYAFYMITYPIVEWAQIGGLGIVWGEFNKNTDWKKTIDTCASLIVNDQGDNNIKLAEKLVEYAQRRDSYIFGIGSRGVLETGWDIQVANAIKESELYETEYYMYGIRLKTDSKLLNAFCGSFPDFGFSSSTSEVFWITCINCLLPEDKRYHTRSGWERRLNDE